MSDVLQDALKRSVGLLGLAAWRRLSGRRREMATARAVAGRLTTATRRILPDTIILGAQKAGTTTLFTLLAHHPLVLTSCTKEVHFFDLQQDRGIDWYRAHFPLMREAEELVSAGTRPAILEASPYYLFHPAVPDRLARILPNARLIVLLRDPVARAWSHYWHERTRGYEWRSPEVAFEREPLRLAGEEDRLLADAGYRSHAHRHFSYLGRSCYADQLQRWLARFPREQILVIRSEDLFASPAATVARTLRFLGLPQAPELDLTRRAGACNGGHYRPLPRTLGKRLQVQLRPANAALRTLLSPAFSW